MGEYIRSNTSGKMSGGYVRRIPVSASALVKGAALMRGTTVGTDMGLGIVAASAAADIIGVTQEASTAPGVYATGTTFNDSFLKDVLCSPDNVYDFEYDLSDTAVAVSSSSTALTVATGNEVLSGGWIYVTAGTGAGQLLFVVNNTDQTITLLSAPAVALDSTSYYIKILPPNALVAKFSSDASKLGTDAGAGSTPVVVYNNRIRGAKIVEQRLSPQKHDGLTGLNAAGMNVSFVCELSFRDHISNPLS